MGQRLDLHALLLALLESDHVYFQRPANVQMQYPAIVYKLDEILTEYANNNPYSRAKRYQVTVIDPRPDSPIFDKVGNLPTASFDRAFVADKLNHQVFNLYF